MKMIYMLPSRFNEKKATLRHVLMTELRFCSCNSQCQWKNIYRVLRENNFKPGIIYSVKLVWKTFSDTKELRIYINQEPSLRILLSHFLKSAEKVKSRETII